MKVTLKIFRLLVILIITVLILSFSASILLQERVADIILKSLNKNLSTKLTFDSFKLSFLKKFPKASFELKDVLINSSSDFNSDSFKEISTDTLLSARFISVEFKITDILKGVYNIESIGARNGIINFYTDTAGDVNYDISLKSENSGNNDFTINLEKITLSDMSACYNNQATQLTINGIIKSGRLKSRIEGKNIDFTASADLEIDSIQLYNTRITKKIATNIDLVLQSSQSGITFEKGALQIENYDFGLDGTISSDKLADLNITGNNIDISKIRSYLPGKYLDLVSEYDPSGILFIECNIQGLLSRISNPHIEINTLLSKGHIVYGKSDLSINELSFAGYYTNGSKNRPETSYITVKDLKGKLGSAEYSGSFKLSGTDNRKFDLALNGRAFPAELKEFFAIQNMSTANGSVSFDLILSTNLNKTGKYTLSDIIDMKPEANLVFNSFSIGFNNDKSLFEQTTGNLSVSNTIMANNLNFTYKGQQIGIDGEFRNLAEWLLGRPVQMNAIADVSFNRFIPEAFLPSPKSSENPVTKKTAFSLPGDITLDINFTIDSLTYKTFSSANIKGALNYKPRLLTFKTLNMESLSGVISGNGFVVQSNSKSVTARANLSVTNIDVKNAFTTFHNFGQDFLKSENLEGILSGSFSILLPMDSMLLPQRELLTAEGKYILVDGALNNFDPVKQLSKFIELSELENIEFEKLENDFFIRNNFLYIPQMDVLSSAADLSVNGKHSFNNDYEYHIKMLLSEILSKKRKKSKSNISEFGVVQDDGLGRTSLLLKIETSGDEVKVGYDIKAAGNEIINNIKSERQTLKTILNQEYGWFKNDTTVQEEASQKPRFSISWEESDSLKITPDTTIVKKEGIIKKLFKRDDL